MDLEALAHALRVNIFVYRATGNGPPGYELLLIGRPGHYIQSIKIAFCPLADKFHGVEKIKV